MDPRQKYLDCGSVLVESLQVSKSLSNNPKIQALLRIIIEDNLEDSVWLRDGESSYGVPKRYLFRYEQLAQLVQSLSGPNTRISLAVHNVIESARSLRVEDNARYLFFESIATIFNGVGPDEIASLRNSDDVDLRNVISEMFIKHQSDDKLIRENLAVHKAQRARLSEFDLSNYLKEWASSARHSKET